MWPYWASHLSQRYLQEDCCSSIAIPCLPFSGPGSHTVLCMPLQADRHAHYVAQSLQASGIEIIPVPVYYPDVQTILGQKAYRTLASIPDRNVDIVDVFRRAEDLAPHLEDILSIKPKVHMPPSVHCSQLQGPMYIWCCW